MKLVFASNNKHKLLEIRQLLSAAITIVSLQEIGFNQDIEETGSNLEENSMLKAQVVWDWLCAHDLVKDIDGVFADDTGLEITALNGAPGVRTARWAGDDACDVNNRQKALLELEYIEDRSARFRTIISLIMHDATMQVEGIVSGKIAMQEEGEGGFGYDPVFIPEGYNSTFASLPAEVKNSISHRGRAMEALKDVLQQYITLDKV